MLSFSGAIDWFEMVLKYLLLYQYLEDLQLHLLSSVEAEGQLFAVRYSVYFDFWAKVLILRQRLIPLSNQMV